MYSDERRRQDEYSRGNGAAEYLGVKSRDRDIATGTLRCHRRVQSYWWSIRPFTHLRRKRQWNMSLQNLSFVFI